MKIVGIYPQSVNMINSVSRSTSGEPIGLAKMLSIAISRGHEVKYIPFIANSVNEMLEKLVFFQPDLILFSLMSSHVPIAIQITNYMKERYPEIKIICGGYHPSATELIQPFDIFIKGEGEIPFDSLLKSFENNEELDTVPGISFFDSEGKIKNNTIPNRLTDIDSYPPPLRSRQSVSQKYYGLILPNDEEQKALAYIEYGRGCFYNCTFCCKDVIWGNTIIFREPTKVVNEMISLNNDYGVNLFFFTDLNFTSNKREVISLCNEIIDRKLQLNWFCMANINTTDEELIDFMKLAGCSKIMYGVESVSKDTRQKVKKPVSSKYKDILEYTAQKGILVHAFYIIGFPWETEQSLLNSIDEICNIPAHQLRIGLATPFPGNSWYNTFSQKDLDDNWGNYDSEHLVFNHENLNASRIDTILKEIYSRFYSNQQYYERVNYFVSNFNEFERDFLRFFHVLKQQGLIDDAIEKNIPSLLKKKVG